MPDHPRVDFAGWANKAREEDLLPKDGESTPAWAARVALAAEAQLRREEQEKAAAELMKRPNETPEEWSERVTKWREEHVEEVATVESPSKPAKKPVKAVDLYDDAARAQLLADVRSGKAVPPTVVADDADDANYTPAARAKILEQARAAADRAETTHKNTPRG